MDVKLNTRYVEMSLMIALLEITIGLIKCESEGLKEYCYNEKYEASCPDNQVIIITMARAGRPFLGRCVDKDRGHLGCQSDVLQHLDAYCSGRKNCEVPVVDITKNQNGCPTDLSFFLAAEYKCIPVITCNQANCEHSDFLHPPPSLSLGYLSGAAAKANSCGTSQCPYNLEVANGQQIRFALFDFTIKAPTRNTEDNQNNNLQCHRFGMIFDGATTKEITNCGVERKRESEIYTTITSAAKVELYGDSDMFMVQYKVHGCADIATPKHASTERSGDNLAVRCDHSMTAWHLQCDEDRWVGEVGTCPDSHAQSSSSRDDNSANSSLGMLFVIGLGVALGIVIGFVLLCVAAMYMKRKNNKEAQKASPLLNGNPQYRDYLSKTGTMFGLYPTGQRPHDFRRSSEGTNNNNNEHPIYRPGHDYTSTLHPPISSRQQRLRHNNRSLPAIHEIPSAFHHSFSNSENMHNFGDVHNPQQHDFFLDGTPCVNITDNSNNPDNSCHFHSSSNDQSHVDNDGFIGYPPPLYPSTDGGGAYPPNYDHQPFHNQHFNPNVSSLEFCPQQQDDNGSSLYNQSTDSSVLGMPPFVAVGDNMLNSTMDSSTLSSRGNNYRGDGGKKKHKKDHIYELPNFQASNHSDRTARGTTDSALPYSVNSISAGDQASRST